jgi:hypothetical protein
MLTLNPVFQSFTGQVIIPIGARAFDINVVSGSAVVNGALYLAGSTIRWTAPGDKTILGGSIAVGCSGAANKTTVFYLQ